MKFTRKQFLQAMAILTKLPARLLGFPFKASAGYSKKPTLPGATWRLGPWVADWRRGKRVIVVESVHPTAQRLILASRRREMLPLRYWGGSTPGVPRRVSPGDVFQLGGAGQLYVSGYCHLRRQRRVFRVDRVELLAEVGEIICITE